MGLLDAPALSPQAASARYNRAARGRMIPVGTKIGPQFDSGVGLSDGVIMGGTARLVHTAVRTVYGVRLAFSNWNSGAANIETDGANAITVAAAHDTLSGVTFPYTFNGALTVVIQPGCTMWTDVLGVQIDAGSAYGTRTFVSVATSGQKFPRCGYFVTGGQEGHNYANSAADISQTGSIPSVNGQRVFGPSAMLGFSTEVGVPVVGFPGDSIAHGSGDNDMGFMQRAAVAASVPYVKVAHPGEPMSGWLGQQGKVRYRRSGLLLNGGVTSIVTDYTVNSLSVSTLLADAVTMWLTMSRIAPVVRQTTLTPQTSSTDSWATAGNQTRLKTQAEEDRRIEFNTWLRDGAPIIGVAPQAPGASGGTVVRAGGVGHPLTSVIETADIAETARNSGKWKSGYTSDGTHPNATGAAALAAALPASLFV